MKNDGTSSKHEDDLKVIRKNKIIHIKIYIYNAIGMSKYDTICNPVYFP